MNTPHVKVTTFKPRDLKPVYQVYDELRREERTHLTAQAALDKAHTLSNVVLVNIRGRK